MRVPCLSLYNYALNGGIHRVSYMNVRIDAHDVSAGASFGARRGASLLEASPSPGHVHAMSDDPPRARPAVR
jgi:hypothetical protein